MTTGRLILVRHAHADGPDSEDPSLSRQGRTQAAALAARLQQTELAGVLHSNRRRSAETARAIAEDFEDVMAQASDLVSDRTPFPSPERRAEYPRECWPWLTTVPPEERDIDGRQISQAADELATLARSGAHRGPLVAVTHSFVISWIVRTVLGAPTAAWTRVSPANTGITEFVCTPDGMDLVSFNDTGHLLCDL